MTDVVLTQRRREMNEHVAAVIIHGFTVTHVVTAAMLGPAAGAALTPMTTAMIFAIGFQCSSSFTVAKALKLVAHFAGLLAGVAIAEFIIGLIPGAGNLANAAATGIVTEVLGWSAFIMLRDNLDQKKKLSGWEKFKLVRAAIKLRAANEKFRNELKSARKQMSPSDRAKYDEYMKTLTDKDAGSDLRRDALIRAQELLKPYGIEL